MKDTLSEMKNNVQGINGRVDEAENQNSNLECTKAKKHPIKTAKTIKNPNK